MTDVERILIQRDGMTRKEAKEKLEELRDMVDEEGMNPEDVLRDEVGLEPDYFFDLMRH